MFSINLSKLRELGYTVTTEMVDGEEENIIFVPQREVNYLFHSGAVSDLEMFLGRKKAAKALTKAQMVVNKTIFEHHLKEAIS